MSLEQKARELAEGLLQSGKSEERREFNVKDSTDTVIVTVFRRRATREMREGKFSDTTVSAHPPGARCPTCGGTGRV